MPQGSGGGPKTPKGKARSAQNARRHGLNSPVSGDPGLQARIDALAALLRPAGSATAARAVAEARVHLDRVRAVKLSSLEVALREVGRPRAASAGQDVTSIAFLKILSRIEVLEDYERRARSSLKRALRGL